MANYLKRCYESLPIKLRLFLGMLLAANTAALAIYLCLLGTPSELTYELSLRYFLAGRVLLFMANKAMPLNDENVEIMSMERTLWNSSTVAILAAMTSIFAAPKVILIISQTLL